MADTPIPVLDPTKKPAGAMTMVYQDHYFLQRWVDYYGRQFGRQHLYILSHGGDPEHDRICEGANVIHLPRDPTMWRMERRRWGISSQFSAGMLRYYNWLFVGDVDEVVIVDPDVAPDLTTYLGRYSNPKSAPASLCPFGIELIHNPEAEPEPLVDDQPILSRRRVFRANANYAKPCILRKETGFTIGGHANSHQPRVLDPHMYLVHLRFFDFERVTTCSPAAWVSLPPPPVLRFPRLASSTRGTAPRPAARASATSRYAAAAPSKPWWMAAARCKTLQSLTV